MTPNTCAYMIAGFVVIFGGIALYILSLFLRARALNKHLSRFKSLAEEDLDLENK